MPFSSTTTLPLLREAILGEVGTASALDGKLKPTLTSGSGCSAPARVIADFRRGLRGDSPFSRDDDEDAA